MFPGAVAISVNYPAPICAMKGSTVTLLCTFRPLQSARQDGEVIKIIRVRWCKNHLICQGSTPSVYDSDSKTGLNPRYKYLGDKVENCTLQITDVQKDDEATLRFRMEANDNSGHYTGQSGVNITVAGKSQMFVGSFKEAPPEVQGLTVQRSGFWSSWVYEEVTHMSF